MTGGPKVAFLGTSEFGAQALAALVRRGRVEVAEVISQPDARAGRSRRLRPPPVALAAAELGLPLRQPERASDEPAGVDAAAVVAFGQLLSPPLLGAYPLFNLHPSLLPRWRGAAPIERALLAGDDRTGVAVIELVEELDAGPVHGLEPFPIGPLDDAGTLAARAVELGVPLLEEALLGRTRGRPQAAQGVSYAAKLTAADRVLDWSRPAAELDRRVRALSPRIGARSALDGRPVTVWRAVPVEPGPGPGEVASPLVVGCGRGALSIEELQPEGRRRMTAAEYLRGLRTAPARAG
jgi:methionyl-tRNA formyltransferase